jgi:hypothetical protein
MEHVAAALREELLAVMDRKDHWAWPHLTRPGLRREQLEAHFRHGRGHSGLLSPGVDPLSRGLDRPR